jgi:hypothetical protein
VSSNGRSERWWSEETAGDDVYKRLNSIVDTIRGQSRNRLERDRRNLRLYASDVSGNGEDALSFLKRDRPQFNLIKQGVDTMVSQVATTKYMPQYVITEGEFTFQRMARLRTRVLEGQIHDLDIHQMMTAAFTEAAILGTAHLVGYLDPETSEPRIDKALPGEILVDPRGAITGEVFDIYRDRGVPRDSILQLYKDVDGVSESDIRSAAAPTENKLLFLPRDRSIDEVQVREGWYWGPGKGRHVIALSNCTLLDEEWEWGNPTVVVRYQRRPVGYWGIGLAEIGCDSQARIDELLTRITDCQRIGTTVWLLLDRNAKIRVETLSNAPMTMVQGDFRAGNMPKLEVFNATPPELYAEIDRIRERFLSETGISALAAESKKPAGLDSGEAQRVYADLTNKRQQPVANNHKSAYQGTIGLLEKLNDRAQKAKPGGYSISARTQRGLVPLTKLVKWSDVAMPPEQYRLVMLLISDLPYQSAGRYAAAQEWVGSGLLSRPNAQRIIIDGPDATFARMEMADQDMAMAQCEDILDGGDAVPDPYQNMQIAADIMRRAYLTVVSQGAPEDVLAKMRAFVDACLPPLPPTPSPDLAMNKGAWSQLPSANQAPPAPAMPPEQAPPGAPTA